MKNQNNLELDDLWVPINSSWRFYKFKLRNGKMIKVPNAKYPKISNIEDLKGYIERFNPIDCYYSVSCFENPQKIKGKIDSYPHYRVADKKFIYANLAIDIDAHDRPLWQAREDTKKLIKFLKEKYFKKPLYTLMSGNGYQIVYRWKPKNINNKNPLKTYQKHREVIVSVISRRFPKLDFDKVVTLDMYGVIRLPKTRHHKGEIARFTDLW